MRGVNYIPGIFHYNQLSWGPCHYYWSTLTGRRLAFRANEIESVRPGLFGNAIVTTTSGYEHSVTSTKPEMIR